MYPNLYYYIKQNLGIDIPFLYIINTFGFFFALAFMTAFFITKIETKRKEKNGIYPIKFKRTEILGMPASQTDLIVNFTLGFIIGFKLLSLVFLEKLNAIDVQQYIFSLKGNLWLGLTSGGLLSFWVWYNAKKKKLAKPQKKILEVPFSSNLQPMFYLVIISTIIGAKLFHNLEYFDDFLQDPIGALFSFGGLTFFGGIIVSFFAVLYYLRKNRLDILHTFDSIALAVILAYGVGRLGCHYSGDGDWGIINSAYVSSIDGKKILKSNDSIYNATIDKHKKFYTYQFGSIENTKHKPFDSKLLPKSLEANSFTHNVINNGAVCEGPNRNLRYNRYLPLPTYPTSLYEAIVSILTFLILFYLRSRITIIPGLMLSIYLMWNGIERFLIEKIRINSYYDISGFKFTQAELISVIFFISGLTLLFIVLKKRNAPTTSELG